MMCETRDLGIKWPHWHTLIFSDETRIDMRFVSPKDGKKMLVQRARSVYWKKWAAKHEYEELKEGAWSSLAKESKGGLDRKASQCGQKDFPGRRMDAKETFRYWLVGSQSMSSLPDGGRHREAQALPLFRTARNQAGDSGRLHKVGAKSENVEERMELAKRYRRAPSK